MKTDDLLLRQVHPSHVQNGLSSAAFRPTPNDEDKLSVDCGAMTTPEASFLLHQKKIRVTKEGHREALKTEGTWGISRGECSDQGLSVTPDPVTGDDNQPPNPAHHLVDFSGITGNPKRKNEAVAKRLRNAAKARGCLYPLRDTA